MMHRWNHRFSSLPQMLSCLHPTDKLNKHGKRPPRRTIWEQGILSTHAKEQQLWHQTQCIKLNSPNTRPNRLSLWNFFFQMLDGDWHHQAFIYRTLNTYAIDVFVRPSPHFTVVKRTRTLLFFMNFPYIDCPIFLVLLYLVIFHCIKRAD